VEAGEVRVTPQWQRVEFNEAFVDPVVIANAIGTSRRAPALIGIRHVEPTGFEIRSQQTTDAAGTSLSAVAGYVALERGTHTLTDGTLVEAGRVAAALSETLHALPFSRPFNHLPVVITTVSIGDEMEPVVSRVQGVTKSGVRVDLYGGGATMRDSSPAKLFYISCKPSSGTLQGMRFEAQRTTGISPGQWHSLAFLGAFDAPRSYSPGSRAVPPPIP
jgi:hypothetical protein